MTGARPMLGFGFLLACISTYWLAQVNSTVKTPCLDEFFHVRQALAYWSHQWHIWDPKITTPPGLYLISYIGLHLGRLVPSEDLLGQLRAHNVLGILLIFPVTNCLVTALRGKRDSFTISHTAFNICLFPPLFFFSALYYTDLISILLVLKAHEAFQNKQPVLVAVYSLISLWFRQTNIFWTAIYLGGSEVVRQIQLRQGKLNIRHSNPTWSNIVRNGWYDGIVHDLTVDSAYFEDYMKLVISLVLVTLKHIRILIQPMLPYIMILAAFASFIIWNGGIVLGDKDNHVASLHLPQMLYVWPYIAFFSWPIILSSLIINVLVSLPSSITGKLPFKIDPRIPEPKIRLVVLLPALILTLLAIHYNTVIHPFTLADNRHYTFYVFRILRRNILIKYLFAPIYLFFAWACIGALTQSSSKSTSSNTKSSTLLLWLITSSLSLTTAPLVEPRYFLLPWITWRLIVSNGQPISDKVGLNSKQAHPNRNSGRLDFQTAVARVSASSLSIETLWYLFINGITGWIFLNKGFTWPNEPEEVMRFMW